MTRLTHIASQAAKALQILKGSRHTKESNQPLGQHGRYTIKEQTLPAQMPQTTSAQPAPKETQLKDRQPQPMKPQAQHSLQQNPQTNWLDDFVHFAANSKQTHLTKVPAQQPSQQQLLQKQEALKPQTPQPPPSQSQKTPEPTQPAPPTASEILKQQPPKQETAPTNPETTAATTKQFAILEEEISGADNSGGLLYHNELLELFDDFTKGEAKLTDLQDYLDSAYHDMRSLKKGAEGILKHDKDIYLAAKPLFIQRAEKLVAGTLENKLVDQLIEKSSTPEQFENELKDMISSPGKLDQWMKREVRMGTETDHQISQLWDEAYSAKDLTPPLTNALKDRLNFSSEDARDLYDVLKK